MVSLIFGVILACIGWYIGGLLFDKPKQNTIPVEPEKNRKPHFTDGISEVDLDDPAQLQLHAVKSAMNSITYEMEKQLFQKLAEERKAVVRACMEFNYYMKHKKENEVITEELKELEKIKKQYDIKEEELVMTQEVCDIMKAKEINKYKNILKDLEDKFPNQIEKINLLKEQLRIIEETDYAEISIGGTPDVLEQDNVLTYCPDCNTQGKKGWRFCAKCGRRF